MIKHLLIQLQAKKWLKQMLSDDVTGDQQKAFVAWIERSEAHKKSYFRQRKAYLKQQSQVESSSLGFLSKNHALPLLSICGVLLVMVLIAPNLYHSLGASAQVEQVIVSKQNRRVLLDDGSVIEAKAGSNITITYSQHQRLIEMVKGEAWFKVAKDTERPFIVHHDQLAVTALGTAFSVKTDTRVEVVVTEHQVKLMMAHQPVQYLAQGEGMRFELQQWQSLSPNQVSNALAWREGKLIFDGEPLSHVLAELAPFLTHKTRLLNPAHGELKVFGSFNTEDAAFALTLIIEGLALKSKIRNEKEIIIF